MQQVLFKIPTKWLWGSDLPIYGFGTMLVVALFLCVWLAGRRAQKVGIDKDRIMDLALWIVIPGIIGARLVYMKQYGQPFEQFFKLWEGGLVFYGSLIGGVVGYFLGYFFVLRKYNLSWRKVADVIAPCAALGLAVGRIGCLLNGCCFGAVAAPGTPALHFPLSAYPRYALVREGLQTTAGFTLRERDDPVSQVDRIEPDSPAEKNGLLPGDLIKSINGHENQIVLQANASAAAPEALDRLEAELKGLGRDPQRHDDGEHQFLKVYYDDPAQYFKDVKLIQGKWRTLELHAYDVVWDQLVNDWERGKNDLTLTVERPGVADSVEIAKFSPHTLGLNPTQVYESISTFLLLLLLLAWQPFRRQEGELLALFLICYPLHRFLNEMLRNDTEPVALGMTLSENGSLAVFVAGVLMMLWLRRRPGTVAGPTQTIGSGSQPALRSAH